MVDQFLEMGHSLHRECGLKLQFGLAWAAASKVASDLEAWIEMDSEPLYWVTMLVTSTWKPKLK